MHGDFCNAFDRADYFALCNFARYTGRGAGAHEQELIFDNVHYFSL
jgi:hypothetical protein